MPSALSSAFGSDSESRFKATSDHGIASFVFCGRVREVVEQERRASRRAAWPRQRCLNRLHAVVARGNSRPFSGMPMSVAETCSEEDSRLRMALMSNSVREALTVIGSFWCFLGESPRGQSR